MSPVSRLHTTQGSSEPPRIPGRFNVAFALAAPDPALLVLDEPWAALDAESGAALTSIVEERCQAGSCVVFTDHGHAATLPAGTRPIEVRDGELRSVTVLAPDLVIVANRQGERRRVSVAAADVARTLKHLLDEGWSVVGVEQG